MTILDWMEIGGLGIAVMGCIYYVISVGIDYYIDKQRDTEK